MTQKITAFIPFKNGDIVVTPDAMKSALLKWCLGKPDASFRMEEDGAWLTAPFALIRDANIVATLPSKRIA